jgi:hypothetical protein
VVIDEEVNLGTSQPKKVVDEDDMLDLAHQREAEDYCD